MYGGFKCLAWLHAIFGTLGFFGCIGSIIHLNSMDEDAQKVLEQTGYSTGAFMFMYSVLAVNSLIGAVVCINWIRNDSTNSRTLMAKFYVLQAFLIFVSMRLPGIVDALISAYFAYECFKFASYYEQ